MDNSIKNIIGKNLFSNVSSQPSSTTSKNSNNYTSFNKNNILGNFSSTFVCTNSNLKQQPTLFFNQNQIVVDNKTILMENIISGKDKRTTIMLRNIPLKYNLLNLVDELNINFAGKFDFVNMPINLDVIL